MKLLPAALGAEPKKVAFLGVLVAVLVVVFFINRSPNSPSAATTSSTPVTAPRPVPNSSAPLEVSGPMPAQRSQRASEASIQDFKPSLKPPDGTDVSRIDPTLRLDSIAKLRTLSMEGGERSIFDFGAAPKPKELPSVKPINPVTVAVAPVPDTPPAPLVPPTPPAPVIPPIPLKFYGYVDASSSSRQAFFLNGDDIFVAGENDMISNRYKILHISANSAIVEDTINKNQQTLPLVEELPG